MASEGIESIGLYFDELNKIRVLDPSVAQQTNELKDECKDFVDKVSEFQRIVDGFIQVVDDMADEVEKAKIKAIGTRNLLKSVTKQRESQQQQLQALIMEKQLELERLRVQYDTLLREENEQLEYIEQLMLQK